MVPSFQMPQGWRLPGNAVSSEVAPHFRLLVLALLQEKADVWRAAAAIRLTARKETVLEREDSDRQKRRKRRNDQSDARELPK